MPFISVSVKGVNNSIYPPDEGDIPTSSQAIVLPYSKDIELGLTDLAYVDHGHYNLNDVVTLCKQSVIAFQFLAISHCEDEALITNTIKILEGQKALKGISLYRCAVSDKILNYIAQNRLLASLDLSECIIPNTINYNTFIKNTGILELNLDRNHFPQLMNKVSRLQHLTGLHIAEAYLEQGDFENIKRNDAIKVAHFSYISFDAPIGYSTVSLSGLSVFKNLEELELTIRGGEIANFAFLRDLTQLKKLTLQRGGLRTKDTKIISCLKDLNELRLKFSYDELTMDNINDFKKLKALRKLNIGNVMISEEVKAELKSLKGISIVIEKNE